MNPTFHQLDSMAHFRFNVIAPVLSKEKGRTRNEQLRERAAVVIDLPDGRRRRFSWMTLEDWLYRFERGGLPALCDNVRRDKGIFRGVPTEMRDDIARILTIAPNLKAGNIIRELERAEVPPIPKPSRSTLYRYIKSIRPQYAPRHHDGGRERRSFEADFSNQLWQADIMYGPKLPKQGADGRWRKEQTYLIAIIDDHSRLIVHGEFGFSQNLPAWFYVLKQACLRRGIPAKLYCDNGQVFRSEHIERICAEMGTHLCFTEVRDAAAKGKIERFFNRVRSQFLEPELELRKPDRLHKFNDSFRTWLEGDYNRSPHRGIDNDSPLDRWLRTSNQVKRISDMELETRVFLFHTTRKVSKTGTFSLDGLTYETNAALACKKVGIHYDPSSQKPPYVSYENTDYGRACLLDRNYNSTRRRRKPKNEEQDK